MLSISPVASSAKAGNYFAKDNYYTKEGADAKGASEWWGKTAEILGLQGEVDNKTFVDLLNGKLPNGEQLGVIKNGKKHHRAGYDLTFSAPKSVSLLGLIAGDKRLIDAHHKAVDYVLGVIEQELASARVKENGEIKVVQTGNLAVAKFHHDTSRALDPALHTHSVVQNMTQRPDGKIRALASQSQSMQAKEGLQGFSERLYHSKKYYGMLYRTSLAPLVKELGYEIDKTHNDGRFEIKGIDRESIMAFSQRREQILEAMSTLGLEGGKQANYANLITRADKQAITREELKTHWQEKTDSLGLDFESMIKTSQEKAQVIKDNRDKVKRMEALSRQAVIYAARHLAERQSVFSRDDMEEKAFSYALGDVTPQTINDAVTQALKVGKHLVSMKEYDGMPHYSTPEAIKLEKQNIQIMQAGKNTVNAVTDAHTVNAMLGEFAEKTGLSLTDGQYNAALMILTGKDRVSGIQGYAGVGKTTLLSFVKYVAEKEGYTLKGISPTAAAGRKLEDETGIPSQTLESFLIQTTNEIKQSKPENATQSQQKALWILDESSMASTRAFNDLVKQNQTLETHLIALGDKKQLASVEAGKPFEQLQNASMQTTVMKDIIRQKEGTRMKNAVLSAIDGRINTALNNVTAVRVIEDKQKRLAVLAQHWLSLSKEEREETLLITPANEDRKEVNSHVREGLKEEQVLQGKGYSQTILVNKGLTMQEKTNGMNYTQGDIVRFNRGSKALGIQAREYYKVHQINKETNTLSLSDKSDNILSWQPHRFGSRTRGAVEVFMQGKREIMQGDSIRWTRNFKPRGLINTEKAIVKSVQDKQMTVEMANGETKTLDTKKPENQHFEYNYAVTAYAAQGESFKQVIAHDESFRKQLTNQKAFYVIISRAKENAYIYTDDAGKYASALANNKGDKLAALDLLPEEYLQSVDEKSSDTEAKPTVQNTQKTKTEHAIKAVTSNQQVPPKNYDYNTVYQAATDNLSHIVESLLGSPNQKLSRANEWRYGHKGSLVISMHGQKAGLWNNFETGEKGNIIQLIQTELCVDYKQAIEYAANELNIEKQTYHGQLHEKTETKIKQFDEKTITEEDNKKIAVANKIWQASKAVEGTLAEKYLREHRGITLENLPDSLRFSPNYYHPFEKRNYPALIAAAQNKTGDIQAIQAICLQENGNKASIDMPKVTHGRLKFGAAVQLGEASDKTYIAEGIETALSALSVDSEAKAIATLSVSNFKNIDLEVQQELIICADNDKGMAQTKAELQEALTHLSQYSEQTKLIIPEQLDENKKTDINDVLQQKGQEAVTDLIKTAEVFESKKIKESEQKTVETAQDALDFLTKNAPENENNMTEINEENDKNDLSFLYEKDARNISGNQEIQWENEI